MYSNDHYNSIAETSLTHWGREKMAAIFQRTFLNAFQNENIWLSIKISVKFVPKGPINKVPFVP